MNSALYEPLKYYELEARELHKMNLTEHFDALMSRARVDEELNRETVRKYHAENENIRRQRKQITRWRILKVLTIIAAVILTPLLGLGIFLGIFLLKKKINPKLKKLNEKLGALIASANALLGEANSQMAPLNALFRCEDTFRVIEKTVPEINFDSRFTVGRLSTLVNDFGYVSDGGTDVSIIDALSGELTGNPFIFKKEKRMQMIDTVYTGSLLISWWEFYTDSKGKHRRRRRTQVLHASLVKPKPSYSLETHLGFGAQAAPDLTFSRKHAHTDDLSEAQIEKKVRRGRKKLQKKAEKALTSGGSFSEMANPEFDVLFGATDRDHEVQFRLLFTPLAQQNTIDLISSETGYGDDFDFYKKKMYNVIRSDHAQSWQMIPSAENYCSYDIDTARKRWMDFNEEYFKSVYFDFAPLLAVPAYQEPPSVSMMGSNYSSSYTPEEHEALANAIGEQYFRHPASATEAILKTSLISSLSGVDRVRITAHSYIAEPRLDYVPVFGGDGRTHPVPVSWTEYIPVEKESEMVLSAIDSDRRDFYHANRSALPNASAYFHGLMAYPVSNKTLDTEIKEIFNKIKK